MASIGIVRFSAVVIICLTPHRNIHIYNMYDAVSAPHLKKRVAMCVHTLYPNASTQDHHR
jgi:hypothetical protein